MFQQLDGRQYVLDNEGERAYGVWDIEPAAPARTTLSTFLTVRGCRLPSALAADEDETAGADAGGVEGAGGKIWF